MGPSSSRQSGQGSPTAASNVLSWDAARSNAMSNSRVPFFGGERACNRLAQGQRVGEVFHFFAGWSPHSSATESSSESRVARNASDSRCSVLSIFSPSSEVALRSSSARLSLSCPSSLSLSPSLIPCGAAEAVSLLIRARRGWGFHGRWD